MSTKPNEEAAFPFQIKFHGPGIDPVTGNPIAEGTSEVYSSSGMSLRDYFAAKAMQGICASGPGMHMVNRRIADEAYAIADAMLEARKQ